MTQGCMQQHATTMPLLCCIVLYPLLVRKEFPLLVARTPCAHGAWCAGIGHTLDDVHVMQTDYGHTQVVLRRGLRPPPLLYTAGFQQTTRSLCLGVPRVDRNGHIPTIGTALVTLLCSRLWTSTSLWRTSCVFRDHIHTRYDTRLPSQVYGKLCRSRNMLRIFLSLATVFFGEHSAAIHKTEKHVFSPLTSSGGEEKKHLQKISVDGSTLLPPACRLRVGWVTQRAVRQWALFYSARILERTVRAKRAHERAKEGSCVYYNTTAPCDST